MTQHGQKIVYISQFSCRTKVNSVMKCNYMGHPLRWSTFLFDACTSHQYNVQRRQCHGITVWHSAESRRTDGHDDDLAATRSETGIWQFQRTGRRGRTLISETRLCLDRNVPKLLDPMPVSILCQWTEYPQLVGSQTEFLGTPVLPKFLNLFDCLHPHVRLFLCSLFNTTVEDLSHPPTHNHEPIAP